MIEKIISDLEKMSGKNEKIDYLKNLSDKKLIKDILYYVYNPFQMYYVKKVKGLNFTGTKKITEKNWNEYKKILNQLNERTISGNNALDMLRNFLSEFSENSGNILLGVLKKKLPIKMNTEINKAFPNLVPNFDVILANKLEAKVSDKGVLQVEKLPFNKNYISRKLDGLRMITIKGEKDVETYSRNGLKYQHFDKIKKSISNISLANIVLDG